jgi:hypothetical protein
MVKIAKKVIVEEEKKSWWPEDADLWFDTPSYNQYMAEVTRPFKDVCQFTLFECRQACDKDDCQVDYAEKVADANLNKEQLGKLIEKLQKIYGEMT